MNVNSHIKQSRQSKLISETYTLEPVWLIYFHSNWKFEFEFLGCQAKVTRKRVCRYQHQHSPVMASSTHHSASIHLLHNFVTRVFDMMIWFCHSSGEVIDKKIISSFVRIKLLYFHKSCGAEVVIRSSISNLICFCTQKPLKIPISAPIMTISS